MSTEQSRAPRVLHLVSSCGLYGAEQVILNLAKAGDLDSYVGALHNAHNPHVEVVDEARRMGLKAVTFRSEGRMDLDAVSEVSRFLRRQNIDIVHTHGYKSDIVGSLAALLGKTKWVATNHLWRGEKGRLRLYESLDAWALRFARQVVAVSDEIKGHLIARNVARRKIRVIDNGIDIDRFDRAGLGEALKSELGIRRGETVVTIVGRLSPEKGHATFLEAVSAVCMNRANVRPLIVGDGSLLGELRAEADRLGLGDRVIFTGFRHDMPAVYAISDVLVSASFSEGLPMTILEAMAAKVPVIATGVGGVPTIIKDKETGLLVNQGDAGQLSAGIESLLADESERCRLVHAAFELVRVNHSYGRMCDAYRQLYREVLQSA